MKRFSRSSADKKDMNFAMRISFGVGLFMLFIKTYAYYLTGSAAILSDASESVIHVFAVGFAAYSMWLSLKPADKNHLYGHEKVAFFSAGFEGAMIIGAACFIFYEAVHKMITGFEIENIDTGLEFIVVVVVINFLLGGYLIRKGKKHKSIVLEANGKHILTDCWTSFAVIAALVLVKWTDIALFDPCIAILAALNILWTGSKLIKRSVGGLMDRADKHLHKKISEVIEQETRSRDLEFHHLRHRQSGSKIFIEFHLLFPKDVSIVHAHELASEIESCLQMSLEEETDVFTHLEPKESHDQTHSKYGLPI
ncbi:MAG: cation diffusion facilitator family transporter [Chlamydiota bacterium]